MLAAKLPFYTQEKRKEREERRESTKRNYLLYIVRYKYLFFHYLEMQKSPYFPSPLRKDYTTKPLRNFVPILP